MQQKNPAQELIESDSSNFLPFFSLLSDIMYPDTRI
jgi:hypothetical protein